MLKHMLIVLLTDVLLLSSDADILLILASGADTAYDDTSFGC